MSTAPLEVVFFDVGGTLVRVEPSVASVYARFARAHGFELDPAAIQARFREAWSHSLRRSHARGFRTSDQILRDEWLAIVRDSLGAAVPAEALGPLFDQLYDHFLGANAWTLVPGTLETLRFLRSKGLRLGVLSNWDARLRHLLAELELDRELDFIVISHEVGYEKPHERIFLEALSQARANPSSTLHVGDSFSADIEPAQKLGMRTLWLAGDEEKKARTYRGWHAPVLPDCSEPFWAAALSGEVTPG